MIAILAWLALAAQAAPNTWELRERELAQSAFPSAVVDRFSVRASNALNREAKKTMADAIDVIRLSPSAWFGAIAPGKVVESAEIERILQGAPGVPVRVCIDKCPPCGTAIACAAGESTGDTVATMMFIRKCALETKGCEGQTLNLRSFFEESLGVFAYSKLVGIGHREKAQRAAVAAARHIGETATAVNGILSRCPGPYGEDDLRFLVRNGQASAPDGASRACGESYRRVADARLKKCEPARSVSDVVRCGPRCRVFLCMAKGNAPQLRTVGNRHILFLREESCEGAEPKALPEFTNQIAKAGC